MKSFTPALAADLASEHVTPILFVRVELDARTDRYCSAAADVTWDGHTWRGVSGMVSVEPIEEGDDLVARGLRFVIGGLSASQTAAFFLDHVQGRPVTCWFGAIGDAGIIADPEVEFVGRLDAPERTIAADGQVTIVIPAESRMMRWAVPNGSRYTHAEQQRLHPGDLFFSEVAAVAESVELSWPSKEYFK